MDDYRSISWSVSFDITINEEEARWDDLTEAEQDIILNSIKEDFYSGMF